MCEAQVPCGRYIVHKMGTGMPFHSEAHDPAHGHARSDDEDSGDVHVSVDRVRWQGSEPRQQECSHPYHFAGCEHVLVRVSIDTLVPVCV